MTFHFEWHFILSDIPFSMTFHLGDITILSDIPFWVTFHFEWHSILSDIPFWVTCHFEWHSIFSDIPFWVTGWSFNLNCETWGGIGLSISNLCVSQWVSERQAELELLAHLKIYTAWKGCNFWLRQFVTDLTCYIQKNLIFECVLISQYIKNATLQRSLAFQRSVLER